MKSVIEREKALTGIFITLNEPTKKMVAEAASAGFAETDNFGRVPRIQIMTIREMVESYKMPKLPGLDESVSFRKAKKEQARISRADSICSRFPAGIGYYGRSAVNWSEWRFDR